MVKTNQLGKFGHILCILGAFWAKNGHSRGPAQPQLVLSIVTQFSPCLSLQLKLFFMLHVVFYAT